MVPAGSWGWAAVFLQYMSGGAKSAPGRVAGIWGRSRREKFGIFRGESSILAHSAEAASQRPWGWRAQKSANPKKPTSRVMGEWQASVFWAPKNPAITTEFLIQALRQQPQGNTKFARPLGSSLKSASRAKANLARNLGEGSFKKCTDQEAQNRAQWGGGDLIMFETSLWIL